MIKINKNKVQHRKPKTNSRTDLRQKAALAGTKDYSFPGHCNTFLGLISLSIQYKRI